MVDDGALLRIHTLLEHMRGVTMLVLWRWGEKEGYLKQDPCENNPYYNEIYVF
jgi:hypothetical protein